MEPTATLLHARDDASSPGKKNTLGSRATEKYNPIARSSNDSGRRRRGPMRAMVSSGMRPAASHSFDFMAGGFSKGASGIMGMAQKNKALFSDGLAESTKPTIIGAGFKAGPPRVTISPSEVARELKAPKPLTGYYCRNNVVLIQPALGTGNDTVNKVLDSIKSSVKAEGGHQEESRKKQPRMKGTLSYGYHICGFEAVVVSLEAPDKTKQLAVELKHTSRTGRAAFTVLLQKVAYDLQQNSLASKMADGTKVLRPTKDVVEEMEKAKVAEAPVIDDADKEDDLCMPSMSGPRKTGLSLDRETSNDLVDFWSTMLAHRSCPDTLKLVARCSEREDNAKVIGGNEKLMKHVIKLVKPHGSMRDQQIIFCALSIVAQVLLYMPDSLVDAGLVDAITDNLTYFGMRKLHLTCPGIQDAAIQSLSTLIEGRGASPRGRS